jgi:DNA-directed RNA polymerase subunit A"
MLQESQKKLLSEIVLPKNLVDEIERVAKVKRLNKEQREKLEEEVRKEYLKSSFEPGEAFGIIAAQSISEPATQMTMRAYQLAGAAGIRVTYGLPRLIEIFDAKSEPETPTMTIFLKSDFNNQKEAAQIAEAIVEKKISDIIRKISINLNEKSVEIEQEDMRNLTKIEKTIKDGIAGIKIKEKSKKIVAIPKEESGVKELEYLKDKVMNLHISGVKGIENAIVRREENDWIINTVGTNLEQILKMKQVDGRRTVSNNSHEVAKILGIEAARSVIINESMSTMQEQGLDIDIRHLMLVGDIMTTTGKILSIGRYGVAGSQTSILARAAFEETIKHLVKASIRNEVDKFQGIFENVMIGQVIPSGTGMFDLIAKFEEEKK